MSNNLLSTQDSARLEIAVGFALHYMGQYLNHLPPEFVQDEAGSKVCQAEDLLNEAMKTLQKRAKKAASRG